MKNIIEQTELQAMTENELTAFIQTLQPATEHQFLKENELRSGPFMVDQEGALYMPLHNTHDELTGIKQITGEQAGLVKGTGNDDAGFFRIKGHSPKLTLVTDDVLIANKVRRATGYKTVIIGLTNDLASIKAQLATRASEEVIVYCFEDQLDLSLELVPLGITSVNCSSTTGLKSRITNQIQQAKLRIPEGYELKPDGVYHAKTGKDGVSRSRFICSPLKVTALTRDNKNESWGRYIELIDADNQTHALAMPNERVQFGDLNPLINRGLSITPNEKDYVEHYLAGAAPTQRARCVSKTGWYNKLFVFPEKIIGTDDEQIVYQPTTQSSVNYDASGNIEQWRDNVASLCKGNTRLAFGVSAAFATMMLPLINGESGGFHFRGESSRGKTTILTLAKSVFGNPQNLPRWRSTVNGLEALAASHNHTILCLDEFGQVAENQPKQAGEAIYMLGNGEGKVRAKSNGASQTVASWQLLYLSAGELSLESAMTKAKMQPRAGQEVRFIDLPSDAGKNLGAFDTVHNYNDGQEFAEAIKDGALSYYGTAAEAFLHKVTGEYDATNMKLRRNIKIFMELLDIENVDPQVRRVAQRFAQVAASGELASELGITGWDEGEANNAALACFNTWIDARGGDGSQEERVALERVNQMLLQHERSRFSCAEREAVRTSQAWGTVDEDHFFVFPEVFQKVICADLDHKTVEKVLKDHGFLLPGKSRVTIQKKYRGKAKRVYKISKNIHGLNSVEAEVEETAEAPPTNINLAA